MIKKNVVKTCSCYVDRAVWFVNQFHQPLSVWQFYHSRLEDIAENKFIKEVRTNRYYLDGENVVKNTIIISCDKCFEFQLFRLSSEPNMISIFDNINCRFVTCDYFTYSDSFINDIFTGNSQFVVENHFLPREVKERLFQRQSSSTENFIRQPKHKSCFTSLQRCHYRFFCTTCKKIYFEFFESDLYVFSSSKI